MLLHPLKNERLNFFPARSLFCTREGRPGLARRHCSQPEFVPGPTGTRRTLPAPSACSHRRSHAGVIIVEAEVGACECDTCLHSSCTRMSPPRLHSSYTGKADVKHCSNGELLEYMAPKREEAPSSM